MQALNHKIKSKGQKCLVEWLERHEKSRYWLAKTLNVEYNVVTFWCKGRYKPTLENALRVSLMTEGAVPVESWFTPALQIADTDKQPSKKSKRKQQQKKDPHG